MGLIFVQTLNLKRLTYEAFEGHRHAIKAEQALDDS